MIKLIAPMKRRPGMSVAEFREYYETKHRVIGEKYLSGYAVKYQRRFTKPTVDRDGVSREAEFDVFLEIWYPNEAAMLECSKRMRTPEAMAEIRGDEEQLFDTRYMRTYILEESESELSE